MNGDPKTLSNQDHANGPSGLLGGYESIPEGGTEEDKEGETQGHVLKTNTPAQVTEKLLR